MSVIPTISLDENIQLPQLGLGCYKSLGMEAYQAVLWAIEAGYRHIDTAALYHNEEAVGRALQDCGRPREEFFVVSKLWPTHFSNPEKAFENTLRQLKLDYLDGYLLHWPGTDPYLRNKAWEALLNCKERGLIRCPGVSNFMPEHLEELKSSGILPLLNQIQLNPWYPQKRVTHYCKANNIYISAWGPIFRGRIHEVPLLQELAEKYQKTPAQITLRWHMQKGWIAIPKSIHQERIRQNADIFDFILSEEDSAKIDRLETGQPIGGNDPYTYDGAGAL